MKPINVRKMVVAALFLAIGLILPTITMYIPEVGKMLCPMHIPVMLCGFICGAPYGLVIGLITPLLRGVLFGMPILLPTGVSMAFELATYGYVTGALAVRRTKSMKALYLTLITAMLAGRAVWGLASIVIYGLMGAGFTWKLFLVGAFGNALPGIAIQLIFIPKLVAVLETAGVMETT